MNQLSPDQSELLAKHLTEYLGRVQSANQRLSEDTRRLRIHNARVQGRGFVELVESEMQLKGLTFDEAANNVAQDHPDLYEKYRTGVQADY